MHSSYWYKQTVKQPLFPDTLWSRPENRTHAGKLGIIGGNVQSFAAVAGAYTAASKAGIGSIRILLPDSLSKTVSHLFVEGDYAPSTPSGSFARASLAPITEIAGWSDGMLIAGDLAHNSETAIVLEKFTQTYRGPLILTKDAVDYFTSSPHPILDRANTLCVLSFAQLQKIATTARVQSPFTFDIDLLHIIENLHEFSSKFSLSIIIKHHDIMIVAANQKVSTTKLEKELPTWRVQTAAKASVWWIQNISNPFEAFTTSIIDEL